MRQLSDSADVVVVGRVAAIKTSEKRGDSEDDVYDELILSIQIVEKIRGDSVGASLELSGIPSSFGLAERLELEKDLPADPALFILRKREDGAYRVVNGFGIWASTSRGAVDAPLNLEPPAEGAYSGQVSSFKSVSELADSLR